MYIDTGTYRTTLCPGMVCLYNKGKVSCRSWDEHRGLVRRLVPWLRGLALYLSRPHVPCAPKLTAAAERATLEYPSKPPSSRDGRNSTHARCQPLSGKFGKKFVYPGRRGVDGAAVKKSCFIHIICLWSLNFNTVCTQSENF